MVGKEPVLQKLAAGTIEVLKRDEGSSEQIDVTLLEMPMFEDLYPISANEAEEKVYPAVRYDPQSIALILHSSGAYNERDWPMVRPPDWLL